MSRKEIAGSSTHRTILKSKIPTRKLALVSKSVVALRVVFEYVAQDFMNFFCLLPSSAFFWLLRSKHPVCQALTSPRGAAQHAPERRSWLRTALLAAMLLGAGMDQMAAAPTKMRANLDGHELPDALKRPVLYFGDIHPLLAEHCVSCHGPEKQKGGLRLDSLAAALEGGEAYGPAIVPGKSIESPLLIFSAHLEPDMQMPPEKDRLSAENLATLRAWIDQGAKWPAKSSGAGASGATLGNQELFFQKAAAHWAFQPVQKAAQSSLKNGPSTIDSLVGAKLKAKGLTLSSRADARTLLKRLHFDLAGLPPGVEEMTRFLSAFATNPDSAISGKVDELLASPHFGERWGRFWLDIARYADTQDFFPQPDIRYPFAWTYRDYVVEAFNSGKPFDQFLREQIAADQMGLKENDPSLAALGFLTVGPRFLRRQAEIINDRIDVVTRGVMSLTVVCARCHDHKYDPIPTADFYALHGVFESTEDLVALPEIALLKTPADPTARGQYDMQKTKAQKELADFSQGLKDKAVAAVLAQPDLYFEALCQMEVKKTSDVNKLLSEKSKGFMETALTPLGKQWGILKKPGKWREDPVTGLLAHVAAAPAESKAAVLAEILQSGLLPGGKQEVNAAVLSAAREEAPADEEALVRLYGRLLAKAKDTPEEALKNVLKAFTGEGGWLDFSLKDVETAHRTQNAGRKDFEKLETVLSDMEAKHPGAPPRAMTVRDKTKPVTPVVFLRGDAARRGDAVDRRFLQVLDPKKTPFAADRSGRRELAERIASGDNPLTPRVWANHVWRHLLGRSLAKTPGDFGLQSPPPSHSELLDWLASALVQRGWSTKQLVRDIVLSATYQQRGAERLEAVALDADNTLLWRANRRRMDFEAMRDSMLATSGQLEREIGGRSVSPSTEPFSGRRTIYGFIDRVNIDPLFTTFDFPSPDIASTERAETLVPQQALFALNDSFIMSQAKALAKQAREAGGGAGAVQWLYQRIFQRSATGSENTMAAEFLQETSGLQEERTTGLWLHGYGSADPAVPRSEAFHRLEYFDPQTKRYQGSRVFPDPKQGFASVTAAGGHPGAGLPLAAVRRWTAPYAGEFMINGEVSVGKIGTGDGVRARVISSEAGLLGEWIAEGMPAKTEIRSVRLKAGEVLDFTVDCRETTNSDGFRWSPTIQLIVGIDGAPAGVQTLWDAQAEFKPPAPPKLEPLEQVAHALLMTNEFLFVD